jgi:hypothetical protein
LHHLLGANEAGASISAAVYGGTAAAEPIIPDLSLACLRRLSASKVR